MNDRERQRQVQQLGPADFKSRFIDLLPALDVAALLPHARLARLLGQPPHHTSMTPVPSDR